jgi:hypothetical protein
MGRDVTLARAVKAALPFVEKSFTHQPLLEARLRLTQLGPEHPDTLRSMNGLAVTHANLRQHAVAARLYGEALALQKAVLGPDHPDTFQTMYNLAISYAALGRQTDALELRQETLVGHPPSFDR